MISINEVAAKSEDGRRPDGEGGWVIFVGMVCHPPFNKGFPSIVRDVFL